MTFSSLVSTPQQPNRHGDLLPLPRPPGRAPGRGCRPTLFSISRSTGPDFEGKPDQVWPQAPELSAYLRSRCPKRRGLSSSPSSVLSSPLSLPLLSPSNEIIANAGGLLLSLIFILLLLPPLPLIPILSFLSSNGRPPISSPCTARPSRSSTSPCKRLPFRLPPGSLSILSSSKLRP